MGVAEDRRAGVEGRSDGADETGMHLQVPGQIRLTRAVHHADRELLGVAGDP